MLTGFAAKECDLVFSLAFSIYYAWFKPCRMSQDGLLGQKLAWFAQLKKYTRFDDFMGPRINISYCCRVTSCKGNLLVTRWFEQWSNSKVSTMLSKTLPIDSSCFKDSEKVYFDIFIILKLLKRRWSQDFGSSRVKQVKTNDPNYSNLKFFVSPELSSERDYVITHSVHCTYVRVSV